MLRPGEIYPADTVGETTRRHRLARGVESRPWVVAVLMTSARFSIRSSLPHCVPFRAGEFGLTKDCVAQAETITYLEASDLDIDAGMLGVLDESRLRDLVRAIGNMMGSDCEPL